MVGWHHQLNGHGFEWILGVGDGQGGLICCSSWGRKELDMTEQLNWTELKWYFIKLKYITCIVLYPDFCNLLYITTITSLIITFLPRGKCLLTSWLQSPSAVILEPRKIKSATVSTVSLSICHEVMGPDAMILVFWMLSFKPTFFTLLFHFHQEAL